MTTKVKKPEEIRLFTMNIVEFYTDIETHILNGYTLVKTGHSGPVTIGGWLSATLVLKTESTSG